MTNLRLATPLAVVLLLVTAIPATPTTIREYRRFNSDQRAVFVSGVISGLAYYFAAHDQPVKSRCIMDWYFGKPGEETPGPRELAIEIALAERGDPDLNEVEGVILSTLNTACSFPPTTLKQ